jgi:hypothetical protein
VLRHVNSTLSGSRVSICCATCIEATIRSDKMPARVAADPRVRCDAQGTLSQHTSDHSKEASCNAGPLSRNEDRSQLFNSGKMVSTAARHTSVTKVADSSARHRIGARPGLTGAVAVASSNPFQLFMMYLKSCQPAEEQAKQLQWGIGYPRVAIVEKSCGGVVCQRAPSAQDIRCRILAA